MLIAEARRVVESNGLLDMPGVLPPLPAYVHRIFSSLHVEEVAAGAAAIPIQAPLVETAISFSKRVAMESMSQLESVVARQINKPKVMATFQVWECFHQYVYFK